MSYNNFLQMTTILESTAGDTWVEQVSNIIVQPIFTLILTCLTFLGFVYQLYSKKINAAGIIATLSLLILFLGFLIQGNVNMHSILIFSIGVILVVIELFVVGAVIGIIGMILITISITTLGDKFAIYACECYRCLDFNDCRMGDISEDFQQKDSVFG